MVVCMLTYLCNRRGHVLSIQPNHIEALRYGVNAFRNHDFISRSVQGTNLDGVDVFRTSQMLEISLTRLLKLNTVTTNDVGYLSLDIFVSKRCTFCQWIDIMDITGHHLDNFISPVPGRLGKDGTSFGSQVIRFCVDLGGSFSTVRSVRTRDR